MSAISDVANTLREVPRRLARQAARSVGVHVHRGLLPNTLPNRLRYIPGWLGIDCVTDVGARYGEYEAVAVPQETSAPAAHEMYDVFRGYERVSEVRSDPIRDLDAARHAFYSYLRGGRTATIRHKA